MAISRSIGGHFEERRSWAASWSRRLAVFDLVLAAVAILAHRLQLIQTPPFFWVVGLVMVIAMLSLLLAAAGFQRVWYLGERGGGDIALAILICAVLMAPVAIGGWLAWTTPALSDISTDLGDPPRLTAAAAFRDSGMNPVAPITPEQGATQEKAYPAITGRRYEAPFEQIAGAVDGLMKLRGWEIVSPLPTGGEMEFTFEALARLPILALPYDVAVRVTDEGNATYVDMRSSSRYGARDLGVNAQRITDFLVELDAQAAALAGIAPPAETPEVEMPLTPPIPEDVPPQ